MSDETIRVSQTRIARGAGARRRRVQIDRWHTWKISPDEEREKRIVGFKHKGSGFEYVVQRSGSGAESEVRALCASPKVPFWARGRMHRLGKEAADLFLRLDDYSGPVGPASRPKALEAEDAGRGWSRTRNRYFGLSLHHEIQWTMSEVDLVLNGPVGAAPPVSVPWRRGDNLMDGLRPALESIPSEDRESITAIGICVPGIERGSRTEIDAALARRWGASKRNLQLFIQELFPSVDRRCIKVGSAAEASALAEFRRARWQGPPFWCNTMAYILIDDYISVGRVSWPGRNMQYESSGVAHSFPRLHPLDAPPPQRLCGLHTNCFQAVASGLRVRQSWGSLPPGDAAREIEASYLAQLCDHAARTIGDVERIVIGFDQLDEEFMALIRREFRSETAGRYRRRIGSRGQFIQRRLYSSAAARLIGALEFAHSVAPPFAKSPYV